MSLFLLRHAPSSSTPVSTTKPEIDVRRDDARYKICFILPKLNEGGAKTQRLHFFSFSGGEVWPTSWFFYDILKMHFTSWRKENERRKENVCAARDENFFSPQGYVLHCKLGDDCSPRDDDELDVSSTCSWSTALLLKREGKPNWRSGRRPFMAYIVAPMRRRASLSLEPKMKTR